MFLGDRVHTALELAARLLVAEGEGHVAVAPEREDVPIEDMRRGIGWVLLEEEAGAQAGTEWAAPIDFSPARPSGT
jgi:hypothetical protein